MEREEFINPGLSIWVVEYTIHRSFPLVWKVTGFALDGYWGFGDSQTRVFKGRATLISTTTKNIIDISISSVHFSRQGFKWLLEKVRTLPESPFLITDNPNTQPIFEGYVLLSEDQDIIDLSEPDDYSYAVSSRNWFGFINIRGQKSYLIAFSPYTNVTVSEKDELWTFEWDCSIGKIRSVV